MDRGKQMVIHGVVLKLLTGIDNINEEFIYKIHFQIDFSFMLSSSADNSHATQAVFLTESRINPKVIYISFSRICLFPHLEGSVNYTSTHTFSHLLSAGVILSQPAAATLGLSSEVVSLPLGILCGIFREPTLNKQMYINID